MQTDLRGRDFISDMDFSKEEIETVMDVAFKLKRDRALGIRHPLLEDKTLALLFFFTSTRTRSSFEVGMAQMAGHAAFIDRSATATRPKRSAKSTGATTTASPSASATGTLATNISTMWPRPAGFPC
jgi:N-acetylornithine carbamoyltransferase